MWYLDVNSVKKNFLILSCPFHILKLAPVVSQKSEKMHLVRTFCISNAKTSTLTHFLFHEFNKDSASLRGEKKLNATKIEKTGIHFKTDVFAAVAVVDAKAPYSRKVPDMAAVTSPENALIVVYCSLYLHKNMISSFMPKSCIRSMG